jgi:fido (protein-threonine AMPylation protein)
LPTPWNTDPPGSQATVRERLTTLALEMIDEAPRRPTPSVDMARGWHRRIFIGVAPLDAYAGNIRDSDPDLPDLFGYEVRVGNRPGLPSADVPQALDGFQRAVQQAAVVLDAAIAGGGAPSEPSELEAVLTLCGQAHGEWIRIHPFANGNGRTARLWSRWFALRYGLPPFVRLMPRPFGDLYAGAAAKSMDGDHGPTIRLFHTMLDIALKGLDG